MAFDAAGNLYVGGEFKNIGGVTNVNCIAKYNISTGTWTSLVVEFNIQQIKKLDQLKYLQKELSLLVAISDAAGGSTNCKNICIL